MTTRSEFGREFPVTREQAYLNSAYVGPIPRSVRDAAVEEADAKMLLPTPGNRSDRAELAREKFARLFGAKNEEVALLYSTSDGENVVTSALDWKAGDNVVLDELHFQTSFVLYRALEKSRGIELRIVPQSGGRARIEDFDSRIDGRTRLLSLAWVSNRNGYRHDLKALSDLAHSKGAQIYVDAIQALGTFPTDLGSCGADFLCTGAFKWLFGGFGVAPLYVREEHLDRIRPDRYGHAQIAEELPDFRFRLHESAKKYEYAALAYGAVFQLDAALDFLGARGPRPHRETRNRARDGATGAHRLPRLRDPDASGQPFAHRFLRPWPEPKGARGAARARESHGDLP